MTQGHQTYHSNHTNLRILSAHFTGSVGSDGEIYDYVPNEPTAKKFLYEAYSRRLPGAISPDIVSRNSRNRRDIYLWGRNEYNPTRQTLTHRRDVLWYRDQAHQASGTSSSPYCKGRKLMILYALVD